MWPSLKKAILKLQNIFHYKDLQISQNIQKKKEVCYKLHSVVVSIDWSSTKKFNMNKQK